MSQYAWQQQVMRSAAAIFSLTIAAQVHAKDSIDNVVDSGVGKLLDKFLDRAYLSRRHDADLDSTALEKLGHVELPHRPQAGHEAHCRQVCGLRRMSTTRRVSGVDLDSTALGNPGDLEVPLEKDDESQCRQVDFKAAIKFFADELVTFSQHMSTSLTKYADTGNVADMTSMYASKPSSSEKTKRHVDHDGGEEKEKKKSKPSAYITYVTRRVKEIGQAMSPKEKFSKAANEWRAMTDDQKKAMSQKIEVASDLPAAVEDTLLAASPSQQTVLEEKKDRNEAAEGADEDKLTKKAIPEHENSKDREVARKTVELDPNQGDMNGLQDQLKTLEQKDRKKDGGGRRRKNKEVSPERLKPPQNEFTTGEGDIDAHHTLVLEDATCPKCNHGKATRRTIRTRSADEGDTAIYCCKKCGHGWSEVG